MDDDDFSINATMVEEFECQQYKAAQLQADLTSAKACIFSFLELMNKESLDNEYQVKILIQKTM